MTEEMPDKGHEKPGIEDFIFSVAFNADSRIFDVAWKYWLSLEAWTKDEAALLFLGIEPDRFHLIEKHPNYQDDMHEPLTGLIRKMPDTMPNISGWLAWFNTSEFSEHMPEPMGEWLDKQPKPEVVENGVERGTASLDGEGQVETVESELMPDVVEPLTDAGAVVKWVKPDGEKEFNLRLEALRRWMTTKGLEPNENKTLFFKHYPNLSYTKDNLYSELCRFDSAFLITESTFNDFWQMQKLLKFK